MGNCWLPTRTTEFIPSKCPKQLSTSVRHVIVRVIIKYLNNSWRRRPFCKHIFSTWAVANVTTTGAQNSLQDISLGWERYWRVSLLIHLIHCWTSGTPDIFFMDSDNMTRWFELNEPKALLYHTWYTGTIAIWQVGPRWLRSCKSQIHYPSFYCTRNPNWNQAAYMDLLLLCLLLPLLLGSRQHQTKLD